jgi:hypothetical protein
VSFLDELKLVTRALQQDTSVDPEVQQRNQKLANEACRVAHDYWNELCAHLNVIQAPSTARYAIDGRQPLQGLMCRNFRVAPHLRLVPGGMAQYDAVALVWQAVGSQRQRIEKQLPHDIERVRANLRHASITASEDGIRHAATGRVQSTAFEFMPEVTASVRLHPLHESGRVKLTFVNVEQLERVEAEFPAVGLRARLLDDIGRWIVGQPHQTLEYASEVKRFLP